MRTKVSMLLQILKPFKHDTLITMGSSCTNNKWYWVIETKDKYGYEHEIYCPMCEEEEEEEQENIWMRLICSIGRLRHSKRLKP